MLRVGAGICCLLLLFDILCSLSIRFMAVGFFSFFFV